MGEFPETRRVLVAVRGGQALVRNGEQPTDLTSSWTFELFTRLVGLGEPLETAIAAPRLHTEGDAAVTAASIFDALAAATVTTNVPQVRGQSPDYGMTTIIAILATYAVGAYLPGGHGLVERLCRGELPVC